VFWCKKKSSKKGGGVGGGGEDVKGGKKGEVAERKKYKFVTCKSKDKAFVFMVSLYYSSYFL